MPFRVSFFKVQTSAKTGGWSENFWSLSADLSQTQAAAAKLAQKLNQCTGAQAFVTAYRISDVTTFRKVVNELTGFGPGPIAANNPDADYPNTALQLVLAAGDGRTTRQWVRGLPDNIVQKSGTYQPTAQFLGRWNSLTAMLTAPGALWAMRVLDAGVVPVPIAMLDPATGIITAPAHGFGPIGTVLFARVKGFAAPKVANKVWRVTVIDSNTVSLSFWTALTGVVPNGVKPTIRRQSYTYIKISTANAGDISSHRTGRPTRLLSGARRKHRI